MARFPFPPVRIVIGVLVLCLAGQAAASDYTLVQQISAVASGQGEADSLFGWSVAVDADLAVAAEVRSSGLPARIRSYVRSGANWVYQPGQDIEIPGDSGAEMSLNGDTLMFSAYRSGAPSRSFLQIYRREGSQWTMEYSTSSTTRIYGQVAAGDYIAVAGIPEYDGPVGEDQGLIHILRRENTGQWNSVFLTPTTPQAGALFGRSVALVAGTIVVGASDETVTDGAGTHARAGAAYIYALTIDTWNQVARLVEPQSGSHAQNRFGYRVAISGADPSTPDRLLVGRASNEFNGRIGIVRGYRRVNETWTPGLTISAPIPSTSDQFGCSLAMDGNWAVIGACASDSAGTDAGAVLIARFNSAFTSVDSLTQRADPQAGASDFMGARVAIDGSGPTVMVGNLSANVYGNPYQGVVLVGRSLAGEVPSLTRAIDLGQGLTSARASEVAVDGDTLIIGAPGEDIGIQHQRGAAYVYRRQSDGQYVFEARLLSPDGVTDDFFGGHVALKGDVALISATGHTHLGRRAAGAVYAFHREGGAWAIEAQFLPPAPIYEGLFGRSIAFDGTSALIGENAENTTVMARSGTGTWTPKQDIPHRGWSTHVQGNTAMLGDPLANGNTGAVAIYALDAMGWQPAATLTGMSVGQNFGTRVSFDGDRAVVASESAIAPIQVYRRNGANWLPEASLLPTDAAADTQCHRAKLRGLTLLIGCWNTTGSHEGTAYVFEKSSQGWIQTQKITLAQPKPSDQFGGNIALNDYGNLFIGAFGRDIDFIDQGAIYVYRNDVLFRSGFE